MSKAPIPDKQESGILTDKNFIPNSLHTWWDNPRQVEPSSKFYSKYEGCLDHEFLTNLFKQLDQNIYRLVRNRMKPGFRKKIDGTTRMIVGCLTKQQFIIYIEGLQSSVKCSNISETSFKLPSLNSDYQMYESNVTCSWKNGNIPHLSHKNDWAYAKWYDDGATEVHRAFVIDFSLVYNTYSGCIILNILSNFIMEVNGL